MLLGVLRAFVVRGQRSPPVRRSVQEIRPGRRAEDLNRSARHPTFRPMPLGRGLRLLVLALTLVVGRAEGAEHAVALAQPGDTPSTPSISAPRESLPAPVSQRSHLRLLPGRHLPAVRPRATRHLGRPAGAGPSCAARARCPDAARHHSPPHQQPSPPSAPNRLIDRTPIPGVRSSHIRRSHARPCPHGVLPRRRLAGGRDIRPGPGAPRHRRFGRASPPGPDGAARFHRGRHLPHRAGRRGPGQTRRAPHR